MNSQTVLDRSICNIQKATGFQGVPGGKTSQIFTGGTYLIYFITFTKILNMILVISHTFL